MACDWIAFVRFKVIYKENNKVKEYIIYDPNVVAVKTVVYKMK